MDGRRFGTRHDLPRVGEHTHELLSAMGYDDQAIRNLLGQGVVAVSA
jgi:crotonobetainyl-CoA:carnitine CoA-transferase CaiB-like acyl-CoA transferase